ncbi:MAG: hypothetical protein U5K73_11035 [Halofilum sp. (in: g-proteobacteria)]|nr:hypothetical protein [Halofilum sp. (in: g-proteobacteria)]
MVPLWLAVIWTVAVAGILAVYWIRYGPANYLWFSDIALIGTVPALWLESSLLASTMLVGTLLPELLWNTSLLSRLLIGVRITGIVDYMFEPERPLHLKIISLFHIPLPLLLLWLVWALGYDPRAPVFMTAIAWTVLPLTRAITDPHRNVNWVHGPGGEGVRQTTLHPLAYLALLMTALPVAVYLPTHVLLLYLFA